MRMSFERPASGDKEPSVSDALAEISALRQQALQGGSVDSENDAFAELIGGVQSGQLSPKEGVEKARGLIGGRQDYH